MYRYIMIHTNKYTTAFIHIRYIHRHHIASHIGETDPPGPGGLAALRPNVGRSEWERTPWSRCRSQWPSTLEHLGRTCEALEMLEVQCFALFRFISESWIIMNPRLGPYGTQTFDDPIDCNRTCSTYGLPHFFILLWCFFANSQEMFVVETALLVVTGTWLSYFPIYWE